MSIFIKAGLWVEKQLGYKGELNLTKLIQESSQPGVQGPIGPQGEIGLTGAPGAVGPAGLEWQGAWVSGTSYIADDAVGYDGASWFCILATSGTIAPNLDTTHWALLASQGAIGPAGEQGPIGPQGTAGTQTLQQTVNLGNTVTGSTNKITLAGNYTTLSNVVNPLTYLELSPLALSLGKGGNSISIVNPLTLSADQVITLPDNSGTIALQTYKSYVAVLTQTGINAPTASVKINEIGTITYAYQEAGEYYINSSALFTNNKTVIFVGPGSFTTGVAILGSTIGSNSIVIVYSRNTSNVGTNGLISEVPIEIRVYN